MPPGKPDKSSGSATLSGSVVGVAAQDKLNFAEPFHDLNADENHGAVVEHIEDVHGSTSKSYSFANIPRVKSTERTNVLLLRYVAFVKKLQLLNSEEGKFAEIRLIQKNVLPQRSEKLLCICLKQLAKFLRLHWIKTCSLRRKSNVKCHFIMHGILPANTKATRWWNVIIAWLKYTEYSHL